MPLLIVMSAMVFIDRWEPEPLKMKIIAFLWGGGVATVSSMIINTALMTNTALVIGDAQKAQAIAAVFVAPVVEETFKGLGVLVIILARRTSINSLLDGIVYGGIVAAGFMFVEDIQYFVRYGSSGTGSLVAIFVMRGLLSPFLHSMATSLTGVAMAWGAIRAKHAWSRILVFLAGWGAAMLVHGLWNSMGSDGMLSTLLKMYLFIQVPLFGTWLTVLIRTSNSEAETIKRGLVPYVRTGWILPAEVSMVTDRGKRKAARKWVARGGAPARKAMRRFMNELASLGLDQSLMTRVGPDPARIEEDRRLLAQAAEHRAEFLRLTAIASDQTAVAGAVGRAQ